MNTLALSWDNLPAIEKRLAEAKSLGFTVCRTNINIPEVTKSGEIDFKLLDALKALYAKYGRKMCLLLYTQVPNQKYWRKFFAKPDSNADAALFDLWQREEKNGEFQDWKNPIGIAGWLEDPLIGFFCRVTEFLDPAYVQMDNEPGNTQNSRRAQWGAAPLGYVHERFRRFLNRLVDGLNGPTIVSTAWETEDEPTYVMQIDSGEGYWLRKCHRYGQNMYFVKWQPGDAPYTVAARFWAKVKECNPYKMPTVVTEYNIPDVPADKEMATLLEIKKQKPTSVSFCCPYFWSDI